MSATLARPPVRRATLLAASIGLNVFLLAVVGSHLFAAGRRPESDARDGPFHHILAALPPAEADRFRAVLDRERPSYQPARDAISTAHRAVAEAVGRTPYDPADVREALARWQASWLAFSSRFNETFLDAVAALSDGGRAELREITISDDKKRQRQGE